MNEPLSREDRDTLMEAERDQRNAGRIIKEKLLLDLPPELHEWPRWFHNAQRYSSSLQQEVLSHPSAQAARPECEALAVFGITPEQIIHACQAPALAIDQLWSGKGWHLISNNPDDTPEHRRGMLPWPRLREATQAMTELPPENAEALLRWLLMVAVRQRRLDLFEGCTATLVTDTNGRSLLLQRTDEEVTLEQMLAKHED